MCLLCETEANAFPARTYRSVRAGLKRSNLKCEQSSTRNFVTYSDGRPAVRLRVSLSDHAPSDIRYGGPRVISSGPVFASFRART